MSQSKQPQLKTADGEMPALGFGTWELKGQLAKEAVHMALDTGYRHIDTARMYANEQEVGEGIAASSVAREEVFLTTKIFKDSLDAESLKKELDTSLHLLGTDYVDLLLIHWPSADVALEETLGAMDQARKAGKTKHIGVSNFTIELLDRAIKASASSIACNQVEYHPYLSQEKLLRFCRGKGVPLVAYCPLAKGRVPRDQTLQEIGEKYGKTGVQVAIRWFLQQDGVGAIPKSSDPSHIQSNFEVFDFELSEADMQRIGSLQQGRRLIDPPWAPEWD